MIGTTLQNRYRLDPEVGHGGMGTVYRAHDTLLDRDVATKIRKAAFIAAAGGVYRNAPYETTKRSPSSNRKGQKVKRSFQLKLK